MKKVEIYTDGACSGNPGPGGWGAILMYNGKEKEISGYDDNSTNNRMELYAPIRALELLKEPCSVKLYSDSAYVVNGFKNKWVNNWQKNGWKTASKKPVENQDLWKRLIELTEKHDVEWIKVKGHSDNVYNNRADFLATEAIKNNR